MRSILIALALTLAASAFLPAVAGAECLPSSEAVFAAHPHAVHASWEGRSHHGRRCWYEDGERHTKVAARSPVQRQRPHAAPPVRTVPPEETAPRWPTTTEAAPPVPPDAINVITTDPSAAEHLRNATREWLAGKYWVLLWRAQQEASE